MRKKGSREQGRKTRGQGGQGELALPRDRREWGLGAKGDKGTRGQGDKGTRGITTNYQLPTTNYPLPITHYHLPITHYHLPITIKMI
ncbi:hypothetical protein [Chroococcidiopsis cubana]|uniref:hypothetical protein n=1 Tax=Chroococcidiopsis cubana TaxID=171392 RepID=UPI002ACEEC0E|nr:hypothetical protein [Chroococcidiopsis cubana]